MEITATELKKNFGRYLTLVEQHEDVLITRNGKVIAKLVNPRDGAVKSISGLLVGRLPADYDTKSLREERLDRYAVAGDD